MAERNNEVLFEDARIVFRNFEGREGKYNEAGKRSFSLVVNDQQAEQLLAEGWAVKTKPPREEGDSPFHHLPVKVNFKGRPPKIFLISSRGRTPLDEQDCYLVDIAEIEKCDVLVNPYDWEVNGKTGRRAYLKTIFVIIHEDALELKYAGVPDIGQQVSDTDEDFEDE